MKLQQLKYVVEVAKNNLNVSQAAQRLFTSQPGISKQIRALEDELGVEIFHRSGKHLDHVTQAGIQIIEEAEVMLAQANRIKAIAADFSDDMSGTLSIATTHTQARYILPGPLKVFMHNHSQISLKMQQGAPKQVADMVVQGLTDFAIMTETDQHFDDLVLLPCFSWRRVLIVAEQHPLTKIKKITLKDLAEHSIVTYMDGYSGRSILDDALAKACLPAKIAITAADSDVLKTYVKLGIGIGVIAEMALVDEEEGVVVLDVDHLFARGVTQIGFKKSVYLRRYMYDFIQIFAPHLTPEWIDRAARCETQAEVNAMFKKERLPVY